MLVVFLNRNRFHGIFSETVIETPIKLNRTLNMTDFVVGTEPDEVLNYTTCSFIQRTGYSVNSGHFFNLCFKFRMMHVSNLMTRMSVNDWPTIILMT